MGLIESRFKFKSNEHIMATCQRPTHLTTGKYLNG
jgi:hypothetical protein